MKRIAIERDLRGQADAAHEGPDGCRRGGVVRRAGRMKEAFRPHDDSYRPIVYPGAIVAASWQQTLGQAFLNLLGSPQGRTALSRFGFQLPPAGAR